MCRPFLVFFAVVIAIVFEAGAQDRPKPPPPPPPLAKQTPADKSELTEEQFKAKIVESLRKPVDWRAYTPPGFEVGFDMPREPIRQIESFYEETLGNTKLEMYLSFGEGATFIVGGLKFPYSITDRSLIREVLQELAKEMMAESGAKLGDLKESDFDGAPGVELSSPPPRSGYIGARLRGLVMGRSMYLFLSAPLPEPSEDEPFSADQIAQFEKDNERFFRSMVLKKIVSTPLPTSVPPIFAGSVRDEIYRSDHFKFSFKVPAGWLEVSQEDVEGIRKVGQDYVAATSNITAPITRPRQNLATFVSRPLGNEGIAMIAINVGLQTSTPADALRVAEATEKVVSRLPTYQITKRPTPTKVAGLEAYVFEFTIRLAERSQRQVVHFLQRKDHVLAITIAYYEEVDRRLALSAIDSIRFDLL